MHEWRDFIGPILLWLAYMAVVGIYVARIGFLVREQQLMERAYRLHLAMARGKAVRAAGSEAGEQR